MATKQAGEMERARRELLRLMFIGVVGVLAPAATTVAGIKYLWGPKAPDPAELDAGNVADYQIGDMKLFGAGELFVTRLPEGFLAINQRSPYMRCKVAWMAGKRQFISPCDGSVFDDKGVLVSGPATRPLGVHRMRSESGKLFVLIGDKNVLKRDSFKREQIYSLA